ncbi:MAG: DUF2283 domain-containing protein [Nanoarchaeota archaeon]
MTKTHYDKETDTLNIEVSTGDYWKSVELPNGIVMDISTEGAITSIEILSASKIFSGDSRKVIDNA